MDKGRGTEAERMREVAEVQTGWGRPDSQSQWLRAASKGKTPLKPGPRPLEEKVCCEKSDDAKSTLTLLA